ncbi:guanine nucleotide-binding protein alpha subunit [Reticulomyxa filosa]|uniref:Guanine nucleotide-binding protein alpha subunit n=1 Tax=Reticulomyxa filosa TaxID=46433 RepID=X6MVL4_RETFI|nr:guanine nucleotide-binding protein alpha subunit [Reticulomyxa filosa]|eukprot:ETO17492.1 guanine nucleotide-binding protein alpha subunit [Reticulomyxa filosa]
MGNTKTKSKDGKDVSEGIDERLFQERKTLTINVLLLGPGGGGKTTILKQMERVHGVKSSLSMKDRGKQGNSAPTYTLERERSETDTNETKPFFKQKANEDNKDEEDPSLSLAVQQDLLKDIEVHIMNDICELCNV